MKLRSLFFIVTFLMGLQLQAAEKSWTYVFWINGDFDYQGPVYGDDESIELEDQPELIYEEVVRLAKADEQNNYIIFFDPKGRGKFYNNKHVEIDVYQKGRERYSAGWRFKEIDATRPGAFQVVANEGMKALGEEWKNSQRMFFFYGEHFPIKGEVDYDYTSYAEGFGLKKFKQGLHKFTKQAGKMDLLVMQTCYVNSLSFLGQTSEFTENFLVPKNAILNTKMNLDAFQGFTGSAEELSRQLKKSNSSHERYEWLEYGASEVLELASLFKRLEKNVHQKSFNRDFVREDAAEYKSFMGQVSTEAIILTSDEALLPFYDYYSLLERYQVRGFELLDQIDAHIDNHPRLENVKEVLHELEQ